MSAAITAAIIVAGGAAYAANKSAKAQQDAAKKGSTDQTTTQNPYDYTQGPYADDINSVLAMQRQLAQNGTPQIGPGGSLTYSPSFGSGNQQQQPASSSNLPAGAHINAQGKMVNSQGKAWNPVRDGGAASGGGNGAKTPTAAAANLTPQQSATNIFNQVAQRGLDAGNTQTIAQGRKGIGNILNAEGQGGTGFQGYNPILDKLAQTLQGNVEGAGGTQNASDLLNRFLNENNRGTGGNGSGGSNGNNGSSGSSPVAGYGTTPGGGAITYTGPQGYNPGVTQPVSSTMPDTMATQSYFGDQIRKIMDDQANDADLKTMIDSMNDDVTKQMYKDLATQDAAAQSGGRFGGDMWKGMANDTRYSANKAELNNAATVRLNDQQARKARQLAALGDVNARDQALLGANVQREGIAAGERSASAAAAAAAGANANQLELAKRGQDLSAIAELAGLQQGNISQLSGIGNTLSSNQLAAMGLIPGLEGVGLSGLGLANQAGAGFVDMRGQDTQKAIAGQQANIARQGLNQQASMWNAGQAQNQVNSYLATLLGIGGMGGTSHTTGTNVQPIGISPTGSAAQAGIGAGLAAYGAFGGYQPSTPNIYNYGVQAPAGTYGFSQGPGGAGGVGFG